MRERFYSEQVGGNWGLPGGYLQAATEPGRNIARGMEQVGDSIAGAIKEYRQHKEEAEFLNGRLESLVPRIQALYANGAQMDPASEESQMAVKLGKYSSLSNAQKKGLLLGAEQYLARADKERDRLDTLGHQQAQEKTAAAYLALAERTALNQQKWHDTTNARADKDSEANRNYMAAQTARQAAADARLENTEAVGAEVLRRYHAGRPVDASTLVGPGPEWRERVLAAQTEPDRRNYALNTPNLSPAAVNLLLPYLKMEADRNDPQKQFQNETDRMNALTGRDHAERLRAAAAAGGAPAAAQFGTLTREIPGVGKVTSKVSLDELRRMQAEPPPLPAADRQRLLRLQKELDEHNQKIAGGDHRYGLANLMSRANRREEIVREMNLLRGATPAVPSASKAPAMGDEKVVVEKDGKRFRLPKGQLEEAQREGYKLVQ